LKGKGAQLLILDPKKIEFETDFNPRTQDMGDIDELARGLKESHEAGREIDPIKVRRHNDTYIVVDGHRRVLAARKAGVLLPALRIKPANDSDKLVRALIGNQGKPLMPVEEALAFKRLVDEHGLKAKDIARATGKSVANVKERLQLAEGDTEVLEAVRKKKVSAGLGAAIVHKSKKSKKKQKHLVRRATKSKTGKRAVHVEVGLNAPDNKRRLALGKYMMMFAKEVKAYNSKHKDDRLPANTKTLTKRFRTQRSTATRIAYLIGVLAGCQGKV
jgi:ParB/RepB/Spo0J family partition protein